MILFSIWAERELNVLEPIGNDWVILVAESAYAISLLKGVLLSFLCGELVGIFFLIDFDSCRHQSRTQGQCPNVGQVCLPFILRRVDQRQT